MDGNQVVITEGGVFSLGGSLEEGQIFVDADSEETVVLVLNGVDIRNKDEAAIHVESAGQTSLRLEAGTENRLQSGAEVNLKAIEGESNEDASGGAIYARDNLSITGEGSLHIYGYINNGIHTSNHLLITNGNVTIEAANNGVKGKDSVTITGGSISIFSLRDGSGKGLKSGGAIVISGGNFTVDSYDDTIHSDDTVTLSGGTFLLSTGDDGIHAETELKIDGGNLRILKSYEGLEANQITIEGGLLIVDGPTDNGNGAIDFGTENGGKCVISGGTVIAVGNSGMAETFDESSKQCSFRCYLDTSFEAGSEIIIYNSDRQETEIVLNRVSTDVGQRRR